MGIESFAGLTSKDNISQLVNSDINKIVNMPAPDHDMWRVEMLKELIEVKWGNGTIDNLEENEINAIIEELCIT